MNDEQEKTVKFRSNIFTIDKDDNTLITLWIENNEEWKVTLMFKNDYTVVFNLHAVKLLINCLTRLLEIAKIEDEKK